MISVGLYLFFGACLLLAVYFLPVRLMRYLSGRQDLDDFDALDVIVLPTAFAVGSIGGLLCFVYLADYGWTYFIYVVNQLSHIIKQIF